MMVWMVLQAGAFTSFGSLRKSRSLILRAGQVGFTAHGDNHRFELGW